MTCYDDATRTYLGKGHGIDCTIAYWICILAPGPGVSLSVNTHDSFESNGKFAGDQWFFPLAIALSKPTMRPSHR